MKCPKCGAPCWGGYVVERVNKKALPTPTVYKYRAYCHYRGSKRTITLKALEEILDKWGVSTKKDIMNDVRQRIGSKVVFHYVKLN